jgi:hypothetical protein
VKLNISPKEVLALYDVLYERFAAGHTSGGTGLFMEGDLREPDDTQLRQLYGRLRAIIVASLANKGVDLFELWEQGQKAKIAALEEDLDGVKQETKDLVDKQPVAPGVPIILSAEDTDVLPDSYPRKRPPIPQGPKPGKYHGHRR